MNLSSCPDLDPVINAAAYSPEVSIFIPLNIEVNLHTELRKMLKYCITTVARKVRQTYSEEIAKNIDKRLKDLIGYISFDTTRKSLVVYVSPVFGKVFYLDTTVELKIIIGNTFEVRELLFAKQQQNKFLVLIISNNLPKVFLTDTGSTLTLRVPFKNVRAFENDIPEKVSNFSDVKQRREIILQKYLSHIDKVLEKLMDEHSFPVFIMAGKRTLGHFHALTHQADKIVRFIPGNYEHYSSDAIRKLLIPFMKEWQHKQNKLLMEKLNRAVKDDKAYCGMQAVWDAAYSRRGKTLLLESNFHLTAECDSSNVLREHLGDDNSPNVIDAVEEVIKSTLNHGGEVRFMEKDMLKDYNRIVLIK